MAADHDTSDRVYHALKADLLAGEFAAGRLQITLLEEHYRASATPVREALWRLVGEGLIAMRPTGGFVYSLLVETDLRDLYEMNLQMALLAVAWRSVETLDNEATAPTERNLDPPIDELFDRLARGARNRAFRVLVDSMNDRMCRVRRAEQAELDGLGREFANLDVLVRTGPEDKLRRAIHRYHRRRLNHVSGIAKRIVLQDAEKHRLEA